MGIPYYFTHIIKNHKHIIDNIKNINNISALYIDANSLIYDSIDFEKFENQNQFEKFIINNVLQKIDNIIQSIKPNKYIYIAFDGVPPFAKLNQQKNRRYKSQYLEILFNKKKPWDTASITPGTHFMNKLNFELKNKYTENKYILSLSDVNGEGEHKIFKHIRNFKDIDKENILIYGMDADLIMLSLNHIKYSENIYLFRETPEFIKSIDSNYDKNEQYYMNISLLGQEIYKILTNKSYNFNNDSNYFSKISDYIFICFLLGNDFIPHSPSINIRTNGIDILIEIYKTTINSDMFLTDNINNKIYWKNFKLFIKKIAENEEIYIKNNFDILNKNKFIKNSNEEEKLFKYNNKPSWDKNYINFINPHEKYWENRYYYSIFDIDINNNRQFISNLSYEYLKILLWCFNYYTSDCLNWEYFYNFNYPPLIMDLYKNIPYFDTEIDIPIKNFININPIITLSYVLPKNSLQLLPDKVKNYLLKNYNQHYNFENKIIHPFCKYIWEGHVEFNYINLNDFINKMQKIL